MEYIVREVRTVLPLLIGGKQEEKEERERRERETQRERWGETETKTETKRSDYNNSFTKVAFTAHSRISHVLASAPTVLWYI